MRREPIPLSANRRACADTPASIRGPAANRAVARERAVWADAGTITNVTKARKLNGYEVARYFGSADGATCSGASVSRGSGSESGTSGGTTLLGAGATAGVLGVEAERSGLVRGDRRMRRKMIC